MRGLALALALMCLMPTALSQEAPAVTPATYQDVPAEVAGQRIFVLPAFELDVYAVRFDKNGSKLCFDLYPSGAWDESLRFSIETDGVLQTEWTQSVSRIGDGTDFYAYELTGPGMPAAPEKVTLTIEGDPAGAVTLRIRARPFTKSESAYFLRDEVMHAGVPDELRAAEDVMAAAQKYVPDGARLIDCYVGERFASIDYRLGGTRAIVDYYEDGHVEKMIREDGDHRIFFASTLDEYTYAVYMNDRRNLAGREELRPKREGMSAIYRSGGMMFKIEGYRIEEDRLMIDWSAFSRRSGLLAMLGSARVTAEMPFEDESYMPGGLNPMQDLARLGGAQSPLKGVQTLRFTEGVPRERFDVTLTLYIVEPLVPITSFEDMTDRALTPSLIDAGDGKIECISDFTWDENGGAGYHDALIQAYAEAHGHGESVYLEGYEALGYVKPVRALELMITVDP